MNIRILFVGAGTYEIYEKAFYNAAKKIENIDANLFEWDPYLKRINNIFLRKFENKYSIGPQINKINKELIQFCKKEHYDIVFFYSCRLITAKTIKRIKDLGSYIAIYNNDDPFATYYSTYFWRNYRQSVQYSDVCYVYRRSNIEDCLKAGAKKTKLLRSYYIEDKNFYIPNEQNNCEVPEVIFLGHYESDGREEYIKLLADNGIHVGVPRLGWEKYSEYRNIELLETKGLYNEMINKAKIALVFLSSINNDTYTRRCFEIPITKTAMFSIYSDDIASMFEKDKEIVFFYNKEELLEKVQYYLQHDDALSEIGEKGFERVKKDGHDSLSRVQEILRDYKENYRINEG